MSADNWRVCPRCLQKETADFEKKKSDVENAYSKVPRDEYEKMRAELPYGFELTENLREDYQIGMGTKGEFFVEYRCSCSECGFTFSYGYEETVKL